jgi:hypothetical protein
MNRKTKLRLKLQETGFASMTDAEALVSLQDQTIAVKQPILSHSIRAYLMPDKWRVIADSSLASAKNAVDALSAFDRFDISNPVYLSKLTAVLDALITDSLITTADKTVILSLGDKLESWCEQNGMTDLRIGEVMEART